MRGADGHGAGAQLSGELLPLVPGHPHSGDQAGTGQHRDAVRPVRPGTGAGAADPAGGRAGHGGDDRPLPAEAPLRLRSVCGRSSGPQLRPGGRSRADAGQHGAAVLPAGAAGGVPLYRGIDGADRRLPVPGAGTYKTVGGWTSGIRAKRTRSSCGSWR